MLRQRFFDENYNYSKISFKLRFVNVSEDSIISRKKFRKLYFLHFVSCIKMFHASPQNLLQCNNVQNLLSYIFHIFWIIPS